MTARRRAIYRPQEEGESVPPAAPGAAKRLAAALRARGIGAAGLDPIDAPPLWRRLLAAESTAKARRPAGRPTKWTTARLIGVYRALLRWRRRIEERRGRAFASWEQALRSGGADPRVSKTLQNVISRGKKLSRKSSI